jgi:alanine dehydrogenase
VIQIDILKLSEAEVSSLATMEDILEVIELAFREYTHGYAQMPPKVYLNFRKHNGDLRSMPAYLERLNISTVKVVNVHPDNPKKYGKPSVMAIILLLDPKDGQLMSIMGGRAITALRTGAVGGIAAKYLAVKNPKTVSFIGAGTQARTQLEALLVIFPALSEIRVWDIRHQAAKTFVEEIKQKNSQLEAVFIDTAQAAVELADIVVTTTPSTKPIIMNEWVCEGAHFNCIGADAAGKEELDPAILKRSKIVVDDWTQASHSGEINIPFSRGILSRDKIWAELGEVVAGNKAGRISSNEVTIFDSTGLAIQDAITADLIYRKAIKKRIGKIIHI